MGVDCLITVPAWARIDDVATVIGAAAGCKMTLDDIGDRCVSAKAHGARVSTCGANGLEACAYIDWLTDQGDHRQGHVMYHFEWENDRGGHGLMPRATPFWVAVGHRLVDFFGGSIVYSDCGDCKWDYAQPWKPIAEIAPSDGKPWTAFQKQLAALKPLTAEEVAAFASVAAYD